MQDSKEANIFQTLNKWMLKYPSIEQFSDYIDKGVILLKICPLLLVRKNGLHRFKFRMSFTKNYSYILAISLFVVSHIGIIWRRYRIRALTSWRDAELNFSPHDF